MNFIKNHKKALIVVLVVLLIGSGAAAKYFLGHKEVHYVTFTARRGDLTQKVSVTGNVVSNVVTNLRFQIGGKIAKINVDVGDQVKKGEVLAELAGTDEKIQVAKARAALQTAEANLALRLAGAPLQKIKVAEDNMKSAQVALEIAKTNLKNVQQTNQENIKDAELNLKNAQISAQAALVNLNNAKTNLDNAIKTNNQLVANAYTSLQVTLKKDLVDNYKILRDDDSIVGVDDKDANQAFVSCLGVMKSPSFDDAQFAYKQARDQYKKVNSEFKTLPSEVNSQSLTQIKNLADEADKMLNLMDNALYKTRVMLNYSVTSPQLTPEKLSSFKALVDMDRVEVSGDLNATDGKKQGLLTAEATAKANIDLTKANYDAAKSKYEMALTAEKMAAQNLNKVKVMAQSALENAQLEVQAREKELGAVTSSYDLTKAPPRPVDIATLKAQVAQAKAALALAEKNLAKTILKAPCDGVVTAVNGEVGENITPAKNFIVIISPDLIIEADVAETDISKVKVGEKVDITFDAFGDSQHFPGKVYFIDPAQTVIQDVVYYKVKVALLDKRGFDIKPGMTANLDIISAKKKNVVYIPQMAVLDSQGKKYVKILEPNGQVKKVFVQLGITGEGGMIEVKSGVKPGDKVILSVQKGS